jgi:RND family efflux transporter MFP subunit
MRFGPKALVPAAVLVGALALSAALVVARPVPEAQAIAAARPVVAVVAVAPRPERMRVRTQGTLEPRTELELVAEVSGRLVWASPALEAGSFFAAGEVLARIEPADYEIARARASAALERARSQRELAAASRARSRALFEAGAASPASRDQVESQYAIALANEREAEAALQQAELELSRTELVAPFAGRVRERGAQVGQLVARGAKLARVFAVDWAELRLPIRSEELAFLELPARPDADPDSAPLVELRGAYGGRAHTWQGRLVRAEGALDPRTRLVHVVARIADPYGLATGAPPLAIGLFVEAEILGRELPRVVALPRGALRGEHEVVVVGEDDALRARRVEVLRIDGETVYVAAGLAAGERVAARVPSTFVEGMPVRVAEAPSS